MEQNLKPLNKLEYMQETDMDRGSIKNQWKEKNSTCGKDICNI